MKQIEQGFCDKKIAFVFTASEIIPTGLYILVGLTWRKSKIKIRSIIHLFFFYPNRRELGEHDRGNTTWARSGKYFNRGKW
jgi:hypothetical protein